MLKAGYVLNSCSDETRCIPPVNLAVKTLLLTSLYPNEALLKQSGYLEMTLSLDQFTPLLTPVTVLIADVTVVLPQYISSHYCAHTPELMLHIV